MGIKTREEQMGILNDLRNDEVKSRPDFRHGATHSVTYVHWTVKETKARHFDHISKWRQTIVPLVTYFFKKTSQFERGKCLLTINFKSSQLTAFRHREVSIIIIFTFLSVPCMPSWVCTHAVQRLLVEFTRVWKNVIGKWFHSNTNPSSNCARVFVKGHPAPIRRPSSSHTRSIRAIYGERYDIDTIAQWGCSLSCWKNCIWGCAVTMGTT